jgi:hypothetical protein
MSSQEVREDQGARMPAFVEQVLLQPVRRPATTEEH